MAKQFTVDDIRLLLGKEMEDEEIPNKVLDVLNLHNGKQLTKRFLKYLPGGEEVWFIRQVVGMTNLETRDYLRSNGNSGISLLVAYALKNITIDATWIAEKNAAYFSARTARNDYRRKCLSDEALLARMAYTVNRKNEALEALNAAHADLQQLTRWGEPFSPDSSMWEKLGTTKDK